MGDEVLAHTLANAFTLVAVAVLYFNYLLFQVCRSSDLPAQQTALIDVELGMQEYFSTISWAILLSCALRSSKDAVFSELKNLRQNPQENTSLLFILVKP